MRTWALAAWIHLCLAGVALAHHSKPASGVVFNEALREHLLADWEQKHGLTTDAVAAVRGTAADRRDMGARSAAGGDAGRSLARVGFDWPADAPAPGKGHSLAAAGALAAALIRRRRAAPAT